MIRQEVCEEYVERGLLNRNVWGDFVLYCYSKETFFSGEWDEITKSCRGLVFYKGVQVNKTFPKIFNLDEIPEVSFDRIQNLLDTEEYVICHKVNGHLTIVDYIPELDEFLVHTKGSLQTNEMNEADADLFYDQYPELIANVRLQKRPFTFMFESLHEDDQHTLYEKEVERYGENRLVLLGGYAKMQEWSALEKHALEDWASLDNTPLSKMHKENLDRNKINEMFNEVDTEGYVIWFPKIDFRVKIKTTDYWKMRFRKDLCADAIIDRFVSGGDDRLFNRYPEEVADKIVELITKYFEFFIAYTIDNTPIEYYSMSKKELGLSNDIPKQQKSLIFDRLNGKIIDSKRYIKSKSFRQMFREYMDNHHGLKVKIKDSLIEFIEDREV